MGRSRRHHSAVTPRFGWLTNSLTLCGLAALAALDAAGIRDDPREFVGFIGCLALVFGLQTVHSSMDTRRWRPGTRAATLTAQAVLTFLPFLWMGGGWPGMTGFLAGSVLLMVDSPFRWPTAGLLLGLTAALRTALAGPQPGIVYFLIQSALIALVVHGLGRLTTLISEVYSAREELARVAVVQERRRFGRDLHDLLGYSLSAIILKGEVADSVLATDRDRAGRELSDILHIAREALADVRQLPRGGKEMSLAREIQNARSLCAAADVEVSVEISCGQLPPALETVMATVLREGVTNLLRHSDARRCVLRVTQEDSVVRLTIVNDGVRPCRGAPVETSGSGLCNLAVRLEQVGGALSAGPERRNRFALVAEVPVTEFARVG